MFAAGYFSKVYFSGSYFSPVTYLIFEDSGGSGRAVATKEKITDELLAKIKRDDEELIGIITVMSKLIL